MKEIMIVFDNGLELVFNMSDAEIQNIINLCHKGKEVFMKHKIDDFACETFSCKIKEVYEL